MNILDSVIGRVRSRLLPAAKRGAAADAAIVDRVTLGDARQQTAVVAPATTPSPPQPVSATQTKELPEQDPAYRRLLQSALRQEGVRRIRELEADLSDCDGAAAVELRHFAAQPDPLLARMARLALRQIYTGSTLGNLMMQQGRADGAAAFLAELGRVAEGTSLDRDARLPSAEEASQAIQVLSDCTRATPPTEEQLRAVCHLPPRLAELAASPPSRLLEKDDPRPALWSRQAGELVERWWRDGLVEVLQSGQKRFPGEMDVGDKRAAVTGNRVEFDAVVARPPATERGVEGARETLAQMHDFLDDEQYSPGLARLVKMFDSDPTRAREIVDAVVAGIDVDHPHDDAIQKTAVMMKHCAGLSADHPLKEAIRPHVDYITSLPVMLEQRGHLSSKYHVSRLFESMHRVYPERLAEKAHRDAMYCMLAQGPDQTGEMEFWSLWHKHPEQVAPTMEFIRGLAPQWSDKESRWGLFSRALTEYGWRPTEADHEFMAAQIYGHPNNPKALDGYYSNAETVLRLLTDMEKRSPGSVRYRDLADVDGHIRPLGEALLQRFRGTHGAGALYRDPTDSNRDVGHHIYALAFPNAGVEASMLAEVEAGARQASLDKMPQEAQQSLAILSSMEEVNPRVEALCTQWIDVNAPQLRDVSPYGLHDVPYVITRRYGEADVRRSLARLKEEPLSPAERMAMVERSETIGRLTRFGEEQVHDATLQAFSQGLHGVGGYAVISNDDEQTLRLFRALGPESSDEADMKAAWTRVQELSDQIGGNERVDKALEVYQEVCRQVAAGADAGEATEQALSAIVLGRKPGQPKALLGGVDRQERQLKINGLNIPVRFMMGRFVPPLQPREDPV